MSFWRSPQEDHEVDPSRIYRDTRSTSKKLISAFKEPMVASITLFVTGIVCWRVYPGMSEVGLIMGALLYHWLMKQEHHLPLRMPKSSGLKDANDKIPGTKIAKDAEGIMYLGNTDKNGQEVWVSDDDARTHTLVFGSTGSGKAQPLDAKILTPNGWVRMGDIRPGMTISTPDGGTALVDGIYPQGKMDIYEVEFEDGRVTRATADHLWEVHNKGWYDRKYKTGESRAGNNTTRTLTTAEIAEKLEKFGNQKYSVRLPEARYNGSQKALPVHPYVMGVMLGDGNFMGKNFRVSLPDLDVRERFAALMPEDVFLKHYDSAAEYDFWIAQHEYQAGRAVNGDYRTMQMRDSFRSLGLWDKASHQKFIPQVYLDASYEDRMQLLQGLMDTDGFAGEHGSISFSTSSERMAREFQQLVWSLGGIAKIREKHPTYTYQGVKKLGRTSYNINIRHNAPETFFTCNKKRKRCENYQYAGNVRLAFKSIRKVGYEHAQCIHVDHPDHLYITDNFVVTHNTEALISFAYNSLVQGSGFIYVDGKGDNSLWTKIYSMVRSMGREDDLLLVNYMTGGRDIHGPQEDKLSNTVNPFAIGSSSALTQLLVGLMDSGSGGNGGDMWKGRAISLISSLMIALVWLRDNRGYLLDVSMIRDYLSLGKVIELTKIPGMPEHGRVALKAYLDSLPGFVERKGANQESTTLEQHGYLQMQFTKILGSLADVYGHIFKTQLGEIDFFDVVVNRRILVVLLPALEKSPDELSNLGKIVVACLKNMMASSLGNKVEGSVRDVVETKPTNAPVPFTTILDEYGYYAVEGFAVMAAQARSLGFGLVYAGQDLPSFQKASKEEASSIVGNCNIKIFMKLEDPQDTFELADKSAGEIYVSNTQGYQMKTGAVSQGYMDSENASIERRSRISVLDLKRQEPGQAHVLFKDKILRIRLFRANPKLANQIRLNHFLRVRPPSEEDIGSDSIVTDLTEKLSNPNFPETLPRAITGPEIMAVQAGIAAGLAKQGPVVGGVAGIVAYRLAMQKKMEAFSQRMRDEDDMAQHSAVTGVPRHDRHGEMDGHDGFLPPEALMDTAVGDSFDAASLLNPDVSQTSGFGGFVNQVLGDNRSVTDILAMDAGVFPDRDNTVEGLAHIEEHAGGLSKEKAGIIADDIVSELDKVMAYPTRVPENCTQSDFADILSQLSSAISGDADDDVE